MSNLGELLKSLRGKRSLRDVADMTELSHTYISDVEKGFRRGSKKPIHPSPDTLKRLAEAYNHPYEDLMKVAGYIEGDLSKDETRETKGEKDVAKRLEEFKKDLTSADGLNFSGEPMSDDAKESLIEAMDHIFRQTQRINKKYTPKKHREDS